MTKITDWSSIKTHPTRLDTTIELVDAFIGFLILLSILVAFGGIILLLK